MSQPTLSETVTTNKSLLAVDQVFVTYKNGNGGIEALNDVSFCLNQQEFLCVLGPSGSGKSTLLKVLAGLVPPTKGEVHYDHSPRIGVVFQQANLMPWRTVLENISLPLEVEGISGIEAARKANELIQLVGLDGFENSWPRDLSGGMAQRVAIARALIHDPDILLLDEPFGALDALTREKMGAELLRIWQADRKTVLMVTHSISEAVLLADRVMVLTSRPGHIKLNIEIELPRPRQDEMRYSDQFGCLSRELRSAIEES